MSKKTNSPVVASSKEAQLATTPAQAQEVVAQQEALKVQAAKAKRVVREEVEVAAVAADEAAEQALAQVSEELFAGADLAGVQIAQAGGAAASGGAAAGGAAAGGLSTGAIAAIAVGAVAVAAAASSGNDTTVLPATNVPAGTQTNQPTQPGSITSTPGAIGLTANTDILTGNIFDANQVFTPGGNQRVNSLQDEDRLTGTGTNPTLNFVFGNPGDNGRTSITPKLTNIQTLNVEFSANAGALRLDLQDAVGLSNAINVTRISDVSNNVQIDNLQAVPTTFTLKDSNSGTATVGFNFAAAAVAGASDVANIGLDRVDVVGLSIEQTQTAGARSAQLGFAGLAEGFEVVNITSSGGTPNAIGTLSAEDVRTLNLSGTQALRIGTTSTVSAPAGIVGGGIEATRYAGGLVNVAGSLTAINASNLAAGVDIVIGAELNAGLDGTSGLNVDMTVTGGAGNDVFRILQGSVEAGDRIIGGGGTNTLQLLGGNGQTVSVANPTTNAPTVTGVQVLDIRSGQDAAAAADLIAVDARAIDGLTTVTIRNEGQNANGSVAEGMTVRLTNANAATTNGLVLLHGTTGNSSLVNNVIDIQSTATGVTTGGITLRDNPNRNQNFSAQVSFDSNGTATDNVNSVVNVNIRDEDTEANNIYLNQFALHSGTVTLTGGRSTDVMNLDVRVDVATSNGGMYGYDLGVSQTDTLAIQPARIVADVSNDPGVQKIRATTFDASTYAGNVVVRVQDPLAATSATGAQLIRTSAGRDTVIFDSVGSATAGLTIADTVSGGAGLDILAIDGRNAAGITLGASELQNTTGFETLQFIGNDLGAYTNGRGATNSYNLTLTNATVDANAATGSTVLNIVNDNGEATAAGPVAGNTGITIDLRALSGGRAINFNGQETDSGAALTVDANAAVTAGVAVAGPNQTTQTNDRFILVDGNTNATMVIDGGANKTGGARLGHTANNDVLEVRNSSTVTIADLANISNVGRIEFTNDTAVVATSVLQLDNATVDRLVNSTLAAVGTNATTIANSFEVFEVFAFDSNAAALTQLNMDASAITNAALRLVVQGDGGADTLVGGAGDDVIRGQAGNDSIVGGAGADTITGGAGADVIATGIGNDVVVFASGAETKGAGFAGTNTTFANIDSVTDFVGNGALAGDSVQLSTAAAAFGAGITFVATGVAGATVANVTAVNVAGGAVTIDQLLAQVQAASAGVASTAATAQVYDVTLAAATGGATRLLIINNATAAIENTDALVNITGVTGALNAQDFVFA